MTRRVDLGEHVDLAAAPWVEANREGRWTDGQVVLARAELLRRHLPRVALLLAALPAAALLAVAIVAEVASQLWPDVGPEGIGRAAFGIFAAVVVALGALGARWIVLPGIAVLRDLSGRTIAAGDGVVEWRDGRWAARVSTPEGQRSLAYPEAVGPVREVEGPLPGPCRVYYAPRAGRVLALEPLGAPSADALGRALASVFRADRDDYATYASGRLAAPGRLLVVRRMVARVAVLCGVWVWLGLDWERLQTDAIWTAVVVAGCAGVSVYLLARLRDLIVDLREGLVFSVAGGIRKARSVPGSLIPWRRAALIVRAGSVDLGRREILLPVSQRRLRATVSGIEYRVFYTPRGRVVVGVEPLVDGL